MNEGPLFAALDAAFDRAVARSLGPGGPTTVLFSGGIDSSLVADAARRVTEVGLLAVGLPDAPDLGTAREAAGLLALPHQERTLERPRLEALLTSLGLREEPEPRRSVLLSLAAAFETSTAPRLLLGQGADELFGGYAHFRGLSEDELERRRRADWQRLVEVDWPATLALAGRSGRELVAPFLDPAVVRVALSVPLEPVGPEELTKPLLRRWASHRGLPASIVERPKRAMQYGTGIAAAIRDRNAATPR